MASRRKTQGSKVREREDATPVAVSMEERTTGQGTQVPLEAGKGRNRFPLEPTDEYSPAF